MSSKGSQPEVAVIGAGVSGLVAARRLAEEGFRVTIYERRKLPGGVWNYTKSPGSTDSFLMSAWNCWSGDPDRQSKFASAVYDDLQTNFPRQLMELQDHKWDNQPLFMSHKLVSKYLIDYARQMPQNVQIRGDKEVVDLYHEAIPSQTGFWKLTFQDITTKTRVTKNYSAVVVAVGVFNKPFVPEFRGLREWGQRWPGSLSHSKTYRSPKNFRGKKVVVVGCGASGFDIANKLSGHAAKLWMSSTTDVSGQLPPGVQRVPRLVYLDPSQRRLHFEHGQQLAGIDHVIFCTGYSYSQPFIRANARSNQPLFPDGPVIRNLHEHVIYVNLPTLAFIGLIKGGVPTFLIVQAQAAFLSRVWAGRDPRLSILLTDGLVGLPSEDEHKEIVRHELPHPKFMDYLLRLELTCLEADSRTTYPQNLPFRWTVDHEWILQNRRGIRAKFFSFDPQEHQGISSLRQLFHAPGDWLGLHTTRFEGVLPFVILHAGYFPLRIQKSAGLPLVTEQLQDPPANLTYIDPEFLVTMGLFLKDYWQKLRNPKSRSIFVFRAKLLVKLCRDGIQDAMAQIEARIAWSRPGCAMGFAQCSQDDLSGLLNHLTIQKQTLMVLYEKLSVITRFHDRDI